MQFEEQLRTVLLNILRTGLLRIRSFGWDGLAEYCAIEPDHLHNIPIILINMKTELLAYYYNTERPSFMMQTKKPAAFEGDWKRLGEILAEMAGSRDAKQ